MFCFSFTWTAGGCPSLESLIIHGVEVLRQIRNMPKLADVPVAILTSSESPADMHRTALLGAARYIRKPSMLQDFLREVGSGVEEILRLRSGSR